MSIYDAIGGAGAVAATVDTFSARVLADPDLAPYFSGTDIGRLRSHQRAFIAAALGAPEAWTGRGMGAAHAGLGITDAHFDAVVGHLVDTLVELGVAQEHIAAIGAALTPLRGEIVTAPAPARAPATS